MWVMGGADRNNNVQLSTQIVSPTGPTTWGPDMTEEVRFSCSSSLGDGSVIVTGGQRSSAPGGSATVEIYNFTTGQWTRGPDLRQRRIDHSCSQVWLDPSLTLGIIACFPHDTNVLSVVVAGGEPVLCHTILTSYIPGYYWDPSDVTIVLSSAELYIPWNNTWVDLPTLPVFRDHDVTLQITNPGMMWLHKPYYGLYLLGGCSYDLPTGMETCTTDVWNLMPTEDKLSHYWTSETIPPLGTHYNHCII